MAIDRKKIIVLYYINELTMKEIAKIMKVKSEETIRYQLFLKEPKLKKRNREWTTTDDYELALHFAKLATGKDFNEDVEKIALTMQFAKSIIEDKILPMWEEKYSRVINTNKVEELFENVESLKNDNIIKKQATNKVQLKIYTKELFMDNMKINIKFHKQSIEEVEKNKYIDKESNVINLYADHAASISANGGSAIIGTGISVEIPSGYIGLIVPYKELAFNNSVTILNSPCIITNNKSNNYEELKVILINYSHGAMVRTLNIEPGDKIAELLILPIPKIEII